MGYWEGLDREEERRQRALPWPRRILATVLPWILFCVFVGGFVVLTVRHG